EDVLPPTRGRLTSRDELDTQFDMDTEDDKARSKAAAIPIRQSDLDTLPSRVATLKISERIDRS
ncbi:unnamed protein product, partial [Rotaria magnacalcarata]